MPAAPIRWEVFPNPDQDRGGWYSYVEGGGFYLGGDWHPTKADAKAHARKLAAEAAIPEGEPPSGAFA